MDLTLFLHGMEPLRTLSKELCDSEPHRFWFHDGLRSRLYDNLRISLRFEARIEALIKAKDT